MVPLRAACLGESALCPTSASIELHSLIPVSDLYVHRVGEATWFAGASLGAFFQSR